MAALKKTWTMYNIGFLDLGIRNRLPNRITSLVEPQLLRGCGTSYLLAVSTNIRVVLFPISEIISNYLSQTLFYTPRFVNSRANLLQEGRLNKMFLGVVL